MEASDLLKRALASGAILIILGMLWLLLMPAVETHDLPKREAQFTLLQQIKSIETAQSTKIVMPDLRLRPSWLRQLDPVSSKITELDLSGDGLAEGLASIAACHHLRILHLRTEIGDEHLATIAQLRELEVLDLPLASGVTDAGLKSLEGHPQLRLVRLRASHVTDAGLASFTQLPELRWLHLMEVPITDVGLDVFHSMSKLESLYLDGDHATDDGLSALILARPDLHFHRDQVHLPTDPRQRDGHQD